MRTGFIISGSLETRTGGYIYDRQLVNYLRTFGHTVDVINLLPRDYWFRLFLPSRRLTNTLNCLTYDTVLEDELDHPELIGFNRILKRKTGCRIVSIVHNLRSCDFSGWQAILFRQIEKRYLSSVDAFIFNSDTTRRSVEQLLGKTKPCVIASPGGNRLQSRISLQEIYHRSSRKSPLYILFLANLLKGKGLHVLLDALTDIPVSEFQLVVVGDSNMDASYTAAVKAQIKESGLRGSVTLLGSLDNDELAAVLIKSHILAVPSNYEGYGIAYSEAMSFGLPAIGTTAGAAGEIIKHGYNGFLIPPGDSEALAAILKRFINDSNLLLELSLNAFKSSQTHPTWENTFENIERFLLTVMDNCR